MEKEFEALKTLKDMLIGNGCNNIINNYVDDLILPIEQALTELKAIKKTKPSEALKCLYKVASKVELADCDDYWEVRNAYAKVEQYLQKAQEQKKELANVEKVKSGKIIIYFGKDLLMMNKSKYYEYIKLEKEPISKRILQAKCEEQDKVLNIISTKQVNMAVLLHSSNVKEYNNHRFTPYNLTEEEFAFIKEIIVKYE